MGGVLTLRLGEGPSRRRLAARLPRPAELWPIVQLGGPAVLQKDLVLPALARPPEHGRRCLHGPQGEAHPAQTPFQRCFRSAPSTGQAWRTLIDVARMSARSDRGCSSDGTLRHVWVLPLE